MFCVNCGNELNEGDKFCNKCGAKLQEEKAVFMPSAAHKKRERKQRTGLLIGTIIAAGVILWIALFSTLTVFRHKANDTLDSRRPGYEKSYTPGQDRNYGQHTEEYGGNHSF